MTDPEKMATTRRLRIGDQVQVEDWPGWLTIENNEDPALILLRAPGGALVKVGRLMIAAETVRPEAGAIPTGDVAAGPPGAPEKRVCGTPEFAQIQTPPSFLHQWRHHEHDT